MRLTSLLPVGVSLLANMVAAADSDVIDLTAGTFEQEVMNEKLALVEFFAPWCGHCKNLAPQYETAATTLKSHEAAEAVGGSIKLAKVDCTVEQDLCQEYGIGGYPTLKVFRSGTPTDYTGPRKSDGIVSYMLKQALPAVSKVDSSKHDSFKALENVVLMAYYPESGVPKVFSSLADKLRDTHLFGHVTDQTLAPPDLPSHGIVLYKKFDEGMNVYQGNSDDEDELTAFIAEHSLPIMDEVSPENYAVYAEANLPLAYLFVDPTSKSREALVEAIKPVAKSFKNQVNFVWIDAVKFAEHGKSLSVPLDDLPAMVVQDMASKGKKFVLSATGSKVDATSVKNFVTDFTQNKLTPTLKSAPIPTSQDEAVFTLVTDEFDKVVYDDNKDVFVEFYAPWCGHCQRLAPIWETLAEHFEEFTDTLTIAKMDATENDVPPSAPFEIAGFPTLKFKPAGGRDFIDYTGDRSLESLIDFVMENSNNPIEAALSGDEAEVGDLHDDEQTPVEGHDEL